MDGVRVRADDVEDALVEDEARAGRDVGGRRHDERALAAVEIAEGRVVEQDLVVQLGRELGAAPGGAAQLAPVGRAERAGDDLALHVALQEALLVVGEQLVAVEAVGKRGEAAARYAGDDVDLRRASGPCCPSVRRPRYRAGTRGRRTKRRRRACRRPRRRGRPGSPCPCRRLARLETVAGPRVGLRDRRIDRAGGGGTAAEQQHQHHQERHAQSSHWFSGYVSVGSRNARRLSGIWPRSRSDVFDPDHEASWNGYTAGNRAD